MTMSAIAYFVGQIDNKDSPLLGWKSTVRPASQVLWHWGGKLRHAGMDRYECHERVSWKCLERAHHEIPYTFSGFKAWLAKEGIVFTDYNLDYFYEWDAATFDRFRDFVRHGALTQQTAVMQT